MPVGRNASRRRWAEGLRAAGVVVAIGAIGVLGLGLLASATARRTDGTGARAALPTHGPVDVAPNVFEPHASETRHPTLALYACLTDGTRTYSDHPCGPAAQRLAVTTDRISTYSPTAIDTTPVTVRPDPRPATAIDPEPDAPDNATACAALEREIDAADAAGRAPHGSRESEWLRERWHALRDQAHALQCPGR